MRLAVDVVFLHFLLDRKRNENRLAWKQRVVTGPVLIESRNYSIAILSNVLVETSFGSIKPVFPFLYGIFVSAQLVTNVEVAVSQWHSRDILMYPIIVHSEAPITIFPLCFRR